MGLLMLWGLALVTEKGLRILIPAYHPLFPWAGCAVVLEWHLVWSAESGMETMLSALLALLVLTMIMAKSRTWFAMGLLAGLSAWVRPEGVALMGPALMAVFLQETAWKWRFRKAGSVLIGFGSIFALYILFNLRLAGSPWPNTFYAKQAEYAAALEQPYLTRLLHEPLQLITGVGAVLLPGVILAIVTAVQKREWGVLATIAWLIGFIGLYAWRLPVTYQYGRYIMPVMPVFLFLGLAGLIDFVLKNRNRWGWRISAIWNMSVAVTLLIFWCRGAFLYARDVAIIESEMVATARWVSAELPDGALVAAHDIGALGYFGGHELIDLAGLISPEVIPILRDEAKLAEYLDEQGVDYLVTFPDWYPSMISGRKEIFSTGAPYSPALGGTNMTIYRWGGP
jgi:hypothetical protein